MTTSEGQNDIASAFRKDSDMNKQCMWCIVTILLICVSAIVGCHHGGNHGGYGSCPPQGGYAAPGGNFAPPAGGAAPYQAPRGSGSF